MTSSGGLLLVLIASSFVSVIAFPHTLRAPTMVAVLGGHDPNGWVKNSNCTASFTAQMECNLDVLSLGIVEASKQGAQLVVLPEGYAIDGNPSSSQKFEPFVAVAGAVLCGNETIALLAPRQYRLACAAANGATAVAANVFVALPNNTNRIQEVVYDSMGVVAATYSKIRVLPLVESRFASAGPFVPTTFDLLGRRWGILVCNDGAYPYYTNDWTQLDSLKAQGADTFVWSVGAMVPIGHWAASTATRYSVNMVGSEDVSFMTGSDSAVIVGTDGKVLTSQYDVALQHVHRDYTASGLHLRLAQLP